MQGFTELGPALRWLRERAGLSQRALAQRCRERVPGCNITQAMLSQWERGARRPTLLSLGAVLAGLGLGLVEVHLAMAGPTGAAQTGARWVVGLASGLQDLDRRLARVEADLAQLQAERQPEPRRSQRPAASEEPGW